MRCFTVCLCQLLLATGLFWGSFAEAHLKADEAVFAADARVPGHLPIISGSDSPQPARQWNALHTTDHGALDLFLLEVVQTSALGALSGPLRTATPGAWLLNRLPPDAPGRAFEFHTGVHSSRGPPHSR